MILRTLAAFRRSVRRSCGLTLTLVLVDELRHRDRDALLVAVGLLPEGGHR
jgi:hypothetical protein